MVTQNPDLTYSADVDGHTYRFTVYDADKGFRVLCEVSHLLGAGLHQADMAKFTNEEGAKMNMLLAAARAICGGVGSDANRSLRLVKRLCCDGVEVDGQRLTEQLFVIHFARRMPSLIKVVAAAIEVQFGNFFDLLKSLAGPPSEASASAP